MGGRVFVAFVGVVVGTMRLVGQTPAAIRNQAADLIRSGKPVEAIAILEDAVAKAPTDLRARNLLGIALSGAGRHEAAIDQFRLVLQQDPRFVAAMKNIAIEELQLERDADARGHFANALAMAPDDPAVHYGMGQLEFRARQFDKAAAHFERSGGLYKGNAATLLAYAESCVEIGQGGKAAESLGGLPSDVPGPVHFRAGVLLAKVEEYAAAARQFSLAKGEGTDAYDTGFNLALAQFKAGNNAGAVAAGDELIARGLAKVELYSLMAKAYEAAGKTKEAYESLRAATRLDPHDETPYLDLIALCAEHENYGLGLEIAEVGLRVNAAAYRLRVDRGIVLALLGRMDEAEGEFARAAEARPDETEAPLARAIALMELNRFPEAIDLLRQRRKLRDDNYLVDWHLAEALVKSGADAGADAEAVLRRSIELNAAIPRSHVLLGKILAQRGRTDEAIREFEAALRLDAADVSATYQLAVAYRKKGVGARANELFAKVTQAKAEAAEQKDRRGGLLRIVRDGAR
jgi:tetratricopeptide (TPR) repeat protein